MGSSANIFDQLLTDLCDVLAKATYGTGADDVYGQPAQNYKTQLTAWPCRVTTMTGGREFMVGKEFTKNTFKVFMRLPEETDSGVPFQMNPHNWLLITTANGVALAKPYYLNITAVNDPSLLGHHLECIAEEVIP